MPNKKKRIRQTYSPQFKSQATELAKEIEIKETAEKLGIENIQTLGSWVRHDKRLARSTEFQELESLRTENKRLNKELEIEKRSVKILKTAAAFFCQDQLK